MGRDSEFVRRFRARWAPSRHAANASAALAEYVAAAFRTLPVPPRYGLGDADAAPSVARLAAARALSSRTTWSGRRLAAATASCAALTDIRRAKRNTCKHYDGRPLECVTLRVGVTPCVLVNGTACRRSTGAQSKYACAGLGVADAHFDAPREPTNASGLASYAQRWDAHLVAWRQSDDAQIARTEAAPEAAASRAFVAGLERHYALTAGAVTWANARDRASNM
jgi:hypothetical protein